MRGKETKSMRTMTIQMDHPRLCGEKAKRYAAELPSMGSPPPMRGKAIHKREAVRVPGITPAYAGKRSGRGQF